MRAMVSSTSLSELPTRMELYGVLDPDEVDSVVVAAAAAFMASVLLIVSQIFFVECYGVLVRAIYRTEK